MRRSIYNTKIDDKRGLRLGGISFYVNRCGRMEIFIGKRKNRKEDWWNVYCICMRNQMKWASFERERWGFLIVWGNSEEDYGECRTEL